MIINMGKILNGMKYIIKQISFVCLLLSLSYQSYVYAATYYVDGSMTDDSGNGTSWADAKKYITSGIGIMTGGDTLIIRDGVYTGNSNILSSAPSGSAGNYTKIYAETDWGVTISGTSVRPCTLDSKSYIEIKGFKFKATPSPDVYILNSNHIKIIRCCSDSAGGTSAHFLASNSTYLLFEECYAWGECRYPFQVNAGGGSSQYIVYRRCVVRWDRANTDQPLACFANYDQSYIYYQNCIAIDGVDINNYGTSHVYRGMCGFKTPNGGSYTKYDGCIVLNIEGPGFYFEDSPVENIAINNSVVWDLHEEDPTTTYKPVQYIRARPGNGPLTVTGCTFGVTDGTLGARFEPSNDTINNTIIYGTTLGAGNYSIYNGVTEDYNCFYNNTGGRNKSGGVGANSVTDIDPIVSGLKYLVRIESGSSLATLGESGSQIGAQIIKKIGVSGTLYGDSDWNTLTSDNLWPFPNEDEMRSDMRTDSARGFCADGKTLTKYIWEYMGNTIPANIYTDTSAPSTISDLLVSNVAGTSVTLAWTAPGDDGNSGIATSYDMRYSQSIIDSSNWSSASQTDGEPVPSIAGTQQSMIISGLQTGATYYFALKTSDEIPNISGLSNTISAFINDTTPPVAVSNLTAITGVSDGQVVVNWTAPGDDGLTGQVNNYDLRYLQSAISDSNWATATQYAGEPSPKIAGISESVTLNGLSPGVTYYFALKSSDEAGNSSPLSNITSASAYNSGIPDVIPPAAIINFAAASGAHSGEIVLNWIATGDDGDIGASSSYDIRGSPNVIDVDNWDAAVRVANTPIPKAAGSREKFVWSGLTPGQVYYFAILASDNVGLSSSLSNVPYAIAYNAANDTTPPGQITNLSATNYSDGEVTLDWTAAGGDGDTGTAASYDIRYATYPIDSANFVTATFLNISIEPNSAGFADTASVGSLVNNQLYYFVIKSIDGAGNYSAISNIASVTISDDIVAPGKIQDLSAVTGVSVGSVILGWTAPGNDGNIGKANEYDIRYSTGQITDGGWPLTGKASSIPKPEISGTYQTAVLAGLNPGTTYYFAIKASDLKGNIAEISNQAAAKARQGVPPNKINTLSAKPGTKDGEAILSWVAPAAANGNKVRQYEIRYSQDYIFEINLWRFFVTDETEWSGALKYPADPPPVNPGESQTFTVSGLVPDQLYYFAVKSYDAENNSSVMSNVAQALAFNGPADVTDLKAETGNDDGEVILNWTAPGNGGTTGTASGYIIKYAEKYITDDNWDTINLATNILVPKAAGSRELLTIKNLAIKKQYFFALKTVDSAGNMSGLSNCAVNFSGPPINLENAHSFPNPWRKNTGGLITISRLTENARVNIYTLTGELVKELKEQNGVVFWDAKNEDGQNVASGVYIFYAWDEQGHKKTGKVAIFK